MSRNLQSCLYRLPFLAVGKPHLHRFYSALRAVAVILIYPAAVYGGVLWASVAIIFGNFIVLFLQVLGCRKILGLKFSDYIGSYKSGLIATIPIIIAFDLLWYFEVDNLILVLGIGTAVFIVTFAVSAFLANRSKNMSLRS